MDFRIIAACCALVVGLMVALANPTRRLNHAFGLFSVFVAAWLAGQWEATRSENGLWWVRLACALAVGVVQMMWVVKETAADPDIPMRAHWRKMIPWLVVAALLVWLCFTSYFIPAASTSDRRLYGWGYYTYILTIAGMVLGILGQALFQMRSLSGVRKLELQLLLNGSIAAALAVVVLMILGAVTGNSAFNRAEAVFVFAFYAVTSWAIATTRVFDAHYMLVVGLARLVQAIVIAACGSLVFWLVGQFVPEVIALLVAVAAGLWIATMVEPYLRGLTGLHDTAAESRTAAHDAARRESRPEPLERAFVQVLRSWSKAERAIVLTGGSGGLVGSGLELPGDGVVLRALRQLRWASPERLARERPTEERRELANFLRQQELGALVLSEGPSLSALVGVGIPASRRPFTYPQIAQLQELASIIESALERAYFSVKVQHAEQLATVGLLGASLAHEIRNPLVSIKTFVQLLPTHHADPAFREKFFRLIGDEVGRIDQLTEQLLEMASPRNYSSQLIELHPMLRASIDLVAAKAADKNVQLRSDLLARPDVVFTDASAAKQVILNLCFNALQAVDTHNGPERWVSIATRNVHGGIEMTITDSGSGIAPEIRPRLFQPFQTTKSSGFGLGLAICSDILANLSASISVDPPVPDRGATFRVIFPCQPLSS